MLNAKIVFNNRWGITQNQSIYFAVFYAYFYKKELSIFYNFCHCSNRKSSHAFKFWRYGTKSKTILRQ